MFGLVHGAEAAEASSLATAVYQPTPRPGFRELYRDGAAGNNNVISIDEGEDTDRARLVPVTQTALNEARKAENRVKRQSGICTSSDSRLHSRNSVHNFIAIMPSWNKIFRKQN